MFVEVPVIVELAVPPAVMAAGTEAARANFDCVTVTFAVPVAVPYVESPLYVAVITAVPAVKLFGPTLMVAVPAASVAAEDV